MQEHETETILILKQKKPYSREVSFIPFLKYAQSFVLYRAQ